MHAEPEMRVPTEGKRVVILFNPRSTRGLGNFAAPFGPLLAAMGIHASYDVVIIDQTVQSDWRQRLVTQLARNPVCFGSTSFTGPQIRCGIEASELAKAQGCPVVWGGLHATLQPEQTLAHPSIDYIVEGEGEETFAELVEALAHGRPTADIPGVWSEVDGSPHCGGKRPPVDLKTLPPIPYHLIDLGAYVKPGCYGPAVTLYTSRGCPQHCTFCINERVHGSCWRGFPAERVIEEVRFILKQCPSVTHIQFWDDNFFPSLPRARAIAQGMMEFGDSLTWSVLGTHVRDLTRMSDEYLAFLAKSRLKEVIVGVESGSQRIIDAVRKNFKVEELIEANRRLGACGIRPTYSFISGIPGETNDDLRLSAQLMFRLKKDNPQAIVGNIKPSLCYPGTAYYDKALELGFKPPAKLEDWSNFLWGNYSELDMPWLSPKEKRKLQHLYYYTVILNPVYPMIDSRLFPIMARLLGPIARWRVNRLDFRFPLIAKAMHLIQKSFS